MIEDLFEITAKSITPLDIEGNTLLRVPHTEDESRPFYDPPQNP